MAERQCGSLENYFPSGNVGSIPTPGVIFYEKYINAIVDKILINSPCRSRKGTVGFILDPMEQAVVFIDGAYLEKALIGLNVPKLHIPSFCDYFCKPYERLRTYYYDALPWMPPKDPTDRDRERMAKKQTYLEAVRKQ